MFARFRPIEIKLRVDIVLLFKRRHKSCSTRVFIFWSKVSKINETDERFLVVWKFRWFTRDAMIYNRRGRSAVISSRSVIRRRPIEILRSLESFLEQSRHSQYRSPLSSWILSEPCQIGKRLDGFWWAGEVNQGWLFACSWIKWVIVLMIVRERIILLAKLRWIFVNISVKGVAI